MNDNDKKIRFLRTALYFAFGAFLILWIVAFLQGCTPNTPTASNSATASSNGDNRVVLYCSVDDVYAKPLIKKLEAQTGLKIDALFDTEATKTAGLANRIRAERSRTRADVFWSSVLLQTLVMSDEGLLQEYSSPNAKDLPAEFQGRTWAGVGTRARILMSSKPINTPLMPFAPGLISDGLGMSNPQFGSASDWATALCLRSAEKRARTWPEGMAYFKAFRDRGGRVMPGNGDVARSVGDGILQLGWTDSDDFLAQKREKKTVHLVQTTLGNMLVPGAVALLKNAPHQENAKKLFDAIVSAQNEKALVDEMPGVFSLRHLTEKSDFQSGGEDFSFYMNPPRDDYSKWPAKWREIRDVLNQTLATQ